VPAPCLRRFGRGSESAKTPTPSLIWKARQRPNAARPINMRRPTRFVKAFTWRMSNRTYSRRSVLQINLSQHAAATLTRIDNTPSEDAGANRRRMDAKTPGVRKSEFRQRCTKIFRQYIPDLEGSGPSAGGARAIRSCMRSLSSNEPNGLRNGYGMKNLAVGIAQWMEDRTARLRSWPTFANRDLAVSCWKWSESARSRTRTGTESPPRDFKSLASTDFATRAWGCAGGDSTATPRLTFNKIPPLTPPVNTPPCGAKPLYLRDSRAIDPTVRDPCPSVAYKPRICTCGGATATCCAGFGLP
jgi:hypothetical protein